MSTFNTPTNTTIARTAAASSNRRPARLATRLAVGLGAAALAFGAPVAANAHVTVTPSSTEPGAVAELAMTFSHGCEGSPTTRVEVGIPEAITSVALIANPGWQVESAVQDGARSVVFTALAPLPDGVRETLELEVTLPESAAEGDVLQFPALQVCETGQTMWADADQASSTPAPQLVIGQAPEASSHDASHAEHAPASAPDASHAEHAPASAPAAAAAVEEAPSLAVPLSIAAVVLGALAAVLATIALRRQGSGS